MSISLAEKQIAEHMKAIENIRANQYTQDIIDVLQNKKHTSEELAVVCKAYYDNFIKTHRESFLVKAREERRKNKQLAKQKHEQAIPA